MYLAHTTTVFVYLLHTYVILYELDTLQSFMVNQTNKTEFFLSSNRDNISGQKLCKIHMEYFMQKTYTVCHAQTHIYLVPSYF